ncbi:MAG: ATP-binding protein [Myxococcota bacterium]
MGRRLILQTVPWLGLLACPASHTCHAQADEAVLTAGVPQDWPPQYSLDEHDRPTGFAVDSMEAIAAHAGVRMRYHVYPTFRRALEALESGEVDVVPNLGIIPSRTDRFPFTRPVETFAVPLFVRNASTRYRAPEDLAGQTVGVVESNVAVELLRSNGELKTRLYEDPRIALFELLAGHVEGLAFPEPVALKMAQDIGVGDQLRALDPALVEVKRGVAVAPGRTGLRDRLDAAVERFVRSQRYRDLYAHWYGQPDPFWTTQRVVAGAAFVLLLLVAGFLVWRRRLLQRLAGALRSRRRAEVRYNKLLEQASDGIFVTDLEGNYVDVNEAACRMIGHTREELLRLNVRDLVRPDHLAAQPLRLQRLDAGEQLLVERPLLRKDGTDFPAELSVGRIEDSYVGIVRDVSERKRAEAEIRHHEQLLEHAQRMDAIGRLAGGVAHDFNNLLTAILSGAELLLQDLPHDDPKRGDALEIRAAAERGRTLTRQLLAFGRRQVRNPELLDVGDVVHGMERILHRAAGEKIEVELDLERPALVEMDRSQLEQVILNLVLNARDAQPKGGSIRIATRVAEPDDLPKDGRRGEGKRGPHVVLEVSDQGHGIDPEVHARLFEPFYTTKPRGQGTGLGLSIVHGIVEESGGFIEVETQPERGATFRLYLPQAEGTPHEKAPAPSQHPGAAAAGTVGTVLLVEDEDAVRRMAARALEGAGWSVVQARSAEEALELAERGAAAEVDILVSDVVMPGLDGPALADRLANERPELPVLFVSGYADELLQADALKPAHREFLAKPFALDDLLEAVNRLACR